MSWKQLTFRAPAHENTGSGTRLALEYAVSVASVLLRDEATLTEVPESKSEPTPAEER